MSDKIYLLQDDGSLLAMKKQPYPNEDTLQKLLVDHPDLLAGDQIDTEEPRRWLLISREFGVPLEEGGGSGFNMDHLFIDQDAIPT